MPGPSGLTITVDASSALKALGAYSGPVLAAKLGATLREGALFGERAVAEGTPVNRGISRASVKASQTGLLSWRITSPLAHMPGLEGGTRAHDIVPRRGRFLSFMVGARRVYARRVRHPGTKGRFMFRNGATALRAALPGIQEKHLRAGA